MWNKVVRNFWLILQSAKVNNRPIVENLPNLDNQDIASTRLQSTYFDLSFLRQKRVPRMKSSKEAAVTQGLPDGTIFSKQKFQFG
jgi:hypothetical protein